MRKTFWPLGVAVTVAVLGAVAFCWLPPVPTPTPFLALVPVHAEPSLSVPAEVIDAQWAAVPTYPLPKDLSRTVVLLPGLPALGKDNMAGVVKLWLEDAWLTHQSMYEPDELRHSDWSASLSSAAASLSGNSWDAVFIAFEAPSMCGSGGCIIYILHDIRCADCPRSKLLR